MKQQNQSKITSKHEQNQPVSRLEQNQTTLKQEQERAEMIRQNSKYREGNKPEPDNNPFFENHSNPLSSKGN
ncbi:hypothetical protein [Diplocloster modestus]|uniref:Uncharacterized protein n=1 Tax=Diplocloster modestus TaxID=2850322 RepID=A0ABS6K7L5_9FIRM|nr:hypothetical protein [Diplocloster modestus]MBU9726514.1 hypothetical protein [Diplocloster modestus]